MFVHVEDSTACASKSHWLCTELLSVFQTNVRQRHSHCQAELEGTVRTVKQNLKAKLQKLQKASGSMLSCSGFRLNNLHEHYAATRAPSGRT